MTRHRRLRALIGLAAALGSGCFLFHDDYPDRSCTSNNQCFRAQGEYCDLRAGTCVPAPDANTAPFDSEAAADAAGPDAAPAGGAAAVDAAAPDAGRADAS